MTEPHVLDQPLKVECVDDRLVISIGVRCLGHAISFAPSLTKYDEDADEFIYPEVTDPAAFAKELSYALCEEEEDGTTPVHRMLDAAAMTAIENGAQGVKCPND